MNCREAERELLNDGARPLSKGRLASLERHLSTCAACRARRDDLGDFAEFVKSASAQPDPSPETIRRIMDAAAQQRPRRRPLLLQPVVWRPLLAAAASLAILLGVAGLVQWRRGDATPTPGPEWARLSEVSSLLVMLMEHDDAATEAHAAATTGDLESFARQLLILEGLDAEVVDAADEEVIRLEERQPTTLQWRSSPAFPPGTCV